MTQRLNDVTGEPIKLSATQREQQREAIVHQLNAVILQVNNLTEAIRELREDGLQFREAQGLQQQRQEMQSEFRGRSWRLRWRWILFGR